MRWCLAELASIAALAGDQEAAVGWLERADARAGEANRYFDPWVELDKAWVAAAAGELTRAIDLATQAADMARASKQYTFEAAALHDVARLGAPAAVRQRLEELAGLLEGRLAALLASSAVALAANDGAALDRVGAAFQDLGGLLLAAEAKAAAARAHRAAGRDASANASQERAAALAAACQGARAPRAGGGPAGRRPGLQPRDRDPAPPVRSYGGQLSGPRLRQTRRLQPGAAGHAARGQGIAVAEKRGLVPAGQGRPLRAEGLESVGLAFISVGATTTTAGSNPPSHRALDEGSRTTAGPSSRSASPRPEPQFHLGRRRQTARRHRRERPP